MWYTDIHKYSGIFMQIHPSSKILKHTLFQAFNLHSPPSVIPSHLLLKQKKGVFLKKKLQYFYAAYHFHRT